MLRIFKISQTACSGYDTFSDAIVVAASAADAVLIHPAHGRYEILIKWDSEFKEYRDAAPGNWVESDSDGAPEARIGDWAPHPDMVTAVSVGTAEPHLAAGAVLCASFHAG